MDCLGDLPVYGLWKPSHCNDEAAINKTEGLIAMKKKNPDYVGTAPINIRFHWKRYHLNVCLWRLLPCWRLVCSAHLAGFIFRYFFIHCHLFSLWLRSIRVGGIVLGSGLVSFSVSNSSWKSLWWLQRLFWIRLGGQTRLCIAQLSVGVIAAAQRPHNHLGRLFLGPTCSPLLNLVPGGAGSQGPPTWGDIWCQLLAVLNLLEMVLRLLQLGRRWIRLGAMERSHDAISEGSIHTEVHEGLQMSHINMVYKTNCQLSELLCTFNMGSHQYQEHYSRKYSNLPGNW